jgi:TAP-like protein
LVGIRHAHEPWEWSASVSERKEQYAEAVSNLAPDYFAPFSRASATGLLFSLYGEQCLWWQKPTPSSPVAPAHALYPQVPTLVLEGDLDRRIPLELGIKVAALFPDSTLVLVAGAGHATTFGYQCAANLASQFIESLQVGDLSCTRTPETVIPAVGRFPLFARNARPAAVDPNGHNQIGVAERKVVTVAVATAVDALQRTTLGSTGNGVGLRAGTFQTQFGANGGQTTSLTDCAFAKDVTVNGTVVWGPDLSFVADLTVSGMGTAGGTLHVEGTWQAPGPVGQFKVSGVLGGHEVAVLVPQA